MESIGKLVFEDGTLKASSPNLPTLAYTRPADLAEARLNCDPPVDALEIADGRDLLMAAFAVVPFVRGPLPKPVFGEAVTPSAREAFALFTGDNAAQPANDFRVLRGEVGDFLVCARRYNDVWKAAAFTRDATTLTFRFEDLVDLLPPARTRFDEYLVEVVRDANEKDTPEAIAAGQVRETLCGVAPDARIAIDLAANGGFTLTFWPVAARA